MAAVNEADTRKPIATLNAELDDRRLSDEELEDSFADWYPKFKEAVDQIPGSDVPPPPVPEPAKELKEIRQTLANLPQLIARSVEGIRVPAIVDDPRSQAAMFESISRAIHQTLIPTRAH